MQDQKVFHWSGHVSSPVTCNPLVQSIYPRSVSSSIIDGIQRQHIIIMIPQYNEHLPQSEGPKLHPLRGRKGALTFRRLLSDRNSDGHAHVFEASINGRTYAIKMVGTSFPIYSALKPLLKLSGHPSSNSMTLRKAGRVW
jgi:hypothetical protein